MLIFHPQPRPIISHHSHSFNYDRYWPSLQGENDWEKLEREIARGRRAALPPIHPDSTWEEIEKLRETYYDRNEVPLFYVREEMRDHIASSKLLISVSSYLF